MAGLVLVAVTVLACSAGGSVIVEDPVELQYRQVWRDGVGALAERVKPFYAGICNVGGDQQQCHRASADQAAAIEDFLNRLLGKLAFRWLYWNALLPGRHIPLPAHMSMVGKHEPIPK